MADEGSWTGMLIDPQSGLLLPQALAKSRLQMSQQGEREARGKFFSQMGKSERYSQAGAQEKPPDEPSFRYLRDAYYESQIDQIIVARRQQQVRGVARYVPGDSDTRIGWTVRHRDAENPRFKETADIKRRCAEVAAIIDHPTKEIHPVGFTDVATSATEEELILDRRAMVLFPDRQGLPMQYHLVAGDSVKPIVRVLYEWIEEHKGEENQWGPDMWDVAAESLSYEVGFDLTKAAWVQEIDGVITAAWTAEQMNVAQVFPSVEINRLAYGRGSLFQRSLTLTDLWISLIDYNRGLFSIDYPEQMLLLFGDYSPAGVEAFTRQLTSQVGNRNWSRLAVVPADPEFKAQLQKLRDTPKDMLWPELMRTIIALKAAVYSMHPSEINFETGNDGRPTLNGGTQETQIANAKEEGFDSLLHHQSDWMNRTLVWPRYDDLEMVWRNLHRETEQIRIKLALDRVASYWTINEGRKQENLDPIAEPWADMPLPLALEAQKAALAPSMPSVDKNAPPGAKAPQEASEPEEFGPVKKSWDRTPGRMATTAEDGSWIVLVDGRRYRVLVTPYGTRVMAVNGAVLFQTTGRARNADEAMTWIAAYRTGADEGDDDE